MKKLENLLNFNDFNSNWKGDQAKLKKRTQTSLDILKEDVNEIVPEGLPGLPENENDAIEQIKDFLDDDPDENVIDALVNELRDALLEMEQQGFVEADYTDELDDQFENDWIGWIKAVIELPDFPEEGLNNVMAIINNPASLVFDEDEEEDDLPDFEDEDVECPDCDGTGQDEDGEECERCEGEGRVYRPDDIPPDDL